MENKLVSQVFHTMEPIRAKEEPKVDTISSIAIDRVYTTKTLSQRFKRLNEECKENVIPISKGIVKVDTKEGTLEKDSMDVSEDREDSVDVSEDSEDKEDESVNEEKRQKLLQVVAKRFKKRRQQIQLTSEPKIFRSYGHQHRHSKQSDPDMSWKSKSTTKLELDLDIDIYMSGDSVQSSDIKSEWISIINPYL